MCARLIKNLHKFTFGNAVHHPQVVKTQIGCYGDKTKRKAVILKIKSEGHLFSSRSASEGGLGMGGEGGVP